MSDEQSQQLWQIRSRADVLLRESHVPRSLQAFPLFQVMILPSFTPAVRWQVCKENGQDSQNYLAVRSQWREDLDLEQLKQRDALLPIKRKVLPPLEPTLEHQTSPLSADWCQGMMIKLQQIQIPLYDDGIIRDAFGRELAGADGTYYELAFDSDNVSARFRWWETPPTPWRPLGLFVRETLQTLRSLELSVVE